MTMSNAALSGKYVAYPEYKDSGVEWLGDIPINWKVCRLKYLASICNGQDYKNVQAEHGYPVMGSGGQFAYASQFMYDKPSVLLGRKGTIDKPLYVNFPFWTVDTMYYTKMNQGIDAKYLYYLALTIQFSRYSTNTALPSMTQEHLGNYYFSVPKDEYDREQIANFLDYETSKIDTLIDKQQQLIQLLKEKRQAVISHAVTKGLNPDAAMKDSGVEWLGEVPAHWEVLRLKHLISSLESGCSVNAADVSAQPHEIGVLKTSCVYTRRFRIEENKTVIEEDLSRVKCIARKGAIIISRMNTPELVGASALVDIEVDNIYLPDRLWQTLFNPQFKTVPEYLAYFMTVEGFRTQISLAAEGASSSMQNIAKEDYLAIHSLLPSFDEQLKIVEVVEKKRRQFLHLEQQAAYAVQLLQERRTALISAAVTGKIDVRDWQAPISEQEVAMETST
jgi:type I restriction enzyme S subunit